MANRIELSSPIISTLPTEVPQEPLLTPPVLPRTDTIEMRPQKQSGCLAGLKDKILKFFRWIFLCLCCRSSKPRPQPAPVNPPTVDDQVVEEPPLPILPFEPSFDQGETVSIYDGKNCIDYMPDVIPEESNEEIMQSFKREEAFWTANSFKNYLSRQHYTTDENRRQFKEFPDAVQILVVALQATPEGYDEGKIRLFYPKLNAAYQSAEFPPYAIPKDNILQLQRHLLLQARSILRNPQIVTHVNDFKAALANNKLEDKAMGADPALEVENEEWEPFPLEGEESGAPQVEVED